MKPSKTPTTPTTLKLKTMMIAREGMINVRIIRGTNHCGPGRSPLRGDSPCLHSLASATRREHYRRIRGVSGDPDLQGPRMGDPDPAIPIHGEDLG